MIGLTIDYGTPREERLAILVSLDCSAVGLRSPFCGRLMCWPEVLRSGQHVECLLHPGCNLGWRLNRVVADVDGLEDTALSLFG